MLIDICKAFIKVSEAYNSVYYDIADLNPRDLTILDNADCALLLKKTEHMLDDLRKECKKRRELCEKVACLRYIEGGDYEPIRGELSVCTPSVKHESSIPHPDKDPSEFARLMEWLGVPEESRPLVRVSWKGFSEELTNRAAKGLPLPEGIDPNKTFPVYSLIARAKEGPQNLATNVSEFISTNEVEDVKRVN